MDILIQNTVGETFIFSISNDLKTSELLEVYAEEMELKEVKSWTCQWVGANGSKRILEQNEVIADAIQNPLMDYLLIMPDSGWE